MNIPNIFQATEVAQLIERINMLSPSTKPLWGKMYADQMLAHVNVAYEMAFEDLHPKPKGFKKLILKLFVKKAVTGPRHIPKIQELLRYSSSKDLVILKLNENA